MNIINAAFVRNGVTVRTLPVYQYDSGMILNISGLDDLPSTFRADFANTETGQSKSVIGTDNAVHVPYEYFVPGATIHCWLVWSGEDYTVTRKHIMIPVARRAVPTDEEPTPDEQGVIDQAIAALNDAVAQTGQDVETAAGYAEQAEQSAQAATDAKDNAMASQNAAEAAKDQAVQSAADAAASAQSASESAQSASQSKIAAQEAAASVSGAMDTLEATIQADLQAAKESGMFDGADGVSPTVTVTPITDGHQVMITDADGEHNFDVPNGEPGDDGFSPIATVKQTQTGAVISVTDKTGTTTATVTNGANGDPGTPGTDGFSPVTTVTQTQTGATISITDKTGTTTAQISNGQDGEPGADGVTFTPAVSSEGVISWTNNGGKTNPQPVNIKGPKGDPGDDYVLTSQDKADIAQQAAAEVDVPVQDVQVNGTSILDAQGVANVPIANTETPGVVRTTSWGGISGISGGEISIVKATDNQIKKGVNSYKPIVPSNQEQSVFYGLAKLAGADMESLSGETVGVYPEAQKIAIQKMLGIYEAPWELIREDTFTNAEEADHIITTDANGSPLELTEAVLLIESPRQETQAIWNGSGRVGFRINGYTKVEEVGGYTQAANATAHGAAAMLFRHGNLYELACIRNTTQTNAGTYTGNRYDSGFPELQNYNSDRIGYFIEESVILDRITISKVTGTWHYRLLGKRKWQ